MHATLLFLWTCCVSVFAAEDCEALRKRSEKWLDGRPAPVRDADEVMPGIWLGNVCAAQNESFLTTNAIQAVINVAMEWRGLCNTHAGGEIAFHCFSLDDITIQSETLVRYVIEEAAAMLRNYAEQNVPVLVHCNMGISRSTAVVLRYMQHRWSYRTYDQLLAQIRWHRPVATPNALFQRILGGRDEL
jgi:hypothetical protein